MPRTEGADVPLTDLLAHLIAAAVATPGRPAATKLPGGLCVAALQRPSHLTLTTWRTASKQPSGKEVEIVARDAGLLLPRVSPFTRGDGTPAFAIIDRAAAPDPCDHQLGSPLQGDGRKFFFTSWTCTRCGITVTRTLARRGARNSFEYGDQEVSEGVEVGQPSQEVPSLGLDSGECVIGRCYLSQWEDGDGPSAPVARTRGLGGDRRSDHPGTVALALDRVHAEDPGWVLNR